MWRSSFKINSIKSNRSETKPEKYGVCEKIVNFFKQAVYVILNVRLLEIELNTK